MPVNAHMPAYLDLVQVVMRLTQWQIIMTPQMLVNTKASPLITLCPTTVDTNQPNTVLQIAMAEHWDT